MKVIIVDDEPKAIQLIENYLRSFSDFELAATFRNGLKALEFLHSNQVDLIFLDINMPHLSGISLSKMIGKETAIVFTTAHADYAVESYEVNATDYLLKPISFERFTKAITKILAGRKKAVVPAAEKPEASKTIFIKTGLSLCQIAVDDIEYLQKDGNYMNYFVAGKKIMTRQSVKEALDALPSHFIQIHKTYIINFRKIHLIRSHEVVLSGKQIPIGPNYKSNLSSQIDKI